MEGHAFELSASVEEGELDEHRDPHHMGAQVVEESNGGGGGSPGGDHVVDHQDPISRPSGVAVDLQSISPILERVLLSNYCARQLSRLAHGDESGSKQSGRRSGKGEAACLNAGDVGYLAGQKGIDKPMDERPQRHGVGKDRRDVLEHDSGLGEVRYLADQTGELFHEVKSTCGASWVVEGWRRSPMGGSKGGASRRQWQPARFGCSRHVPKASGVAGSTPPHLPSRWRGAVRPRRSKSTCRRRSRRTERGRSHAERPPLAKGLRRRAGYPQVEGWSERYSGTASGPCSLPDWRWPCKSFPHGSPPPTRRPCRTRRPCCIASIRGS